MSSITIHNLDKQLDLLLQKKDRQEFENATSNMESINPGDRA